MKKEKQINNDDKLKDLFALSKMEASKNLKYRVMQQIRTESEFAKSVRKEKGINRQITDIVTIAGIMYALIALVGLIAYYYGGKTALLSTEILLTAISIVTGAGTCGLIIYFDTRFRNRTRIKHPRKQ